MAAYANITPHTEALLHNYFQHIATGEEKNELDELINESAANECLFDLLLNFIIEKTKIESIPMLSKLISREDTMAFPGLV
ncbi:hypothetical protein [Flavihumibacter profundi]|uniref:hypothetical protein n=1 Tax=Flavihumibacter profundi TaxID=2716883 RepID=UPI001CC59E50|nr:hypothetical protein [Flavihumibacter profundi]MBZ5857394.1 hypothetical protein [Flavihumibacter profundi]